jgi:hypothetical protein
VGPGQALSTPTPPAAGGDYYSGLSQKLPEARVEAAAASAAATAGPIQLISDSESSADDLSQPLPGLSHSMQLKRITMRPVMRP